MFHFKIKRECVWIDGSIGFQVYVWKWFYWSYVGMELNLDSAKRRCKIHVEHLSDKPESDVTYISIEKPKD